MPWKATCAVDERIEFINDFHRKKFHSFSELCRYYAVSRKTGYKWVHRHFEHGKSGLLDRNRTPLSHPEATSPDMVDVFVLLRKRYPKWGPRKLYGYLKETKPDTDWAKPSTIAKLLKKRGLATPKARPRRRPASYTSPFIGYYGPNAVWTTDFKGHMPTRRKASCLPLTVQDACTRFLLAVTAVQTTSFSSVWPIFDFLFTEHGLPDAIRSDNGPPFATVGLGGLGELSRRWIKLGIVPERIEPGKPSQNGRHERMHRTLKESVGDAIEKAPARQIQPIFDGFRVEYNEIRPHEALNNKTPSRLYCNSTKTYPKKLRDPRYPDTMLVERANPRGQLFYMGQSFGLSAVIRNELIGILPVDNDRTNLYFGPILLGYITPTHFKANRKRIGKRQFYPNRNRNCYPCS